MGIAAVPRYLAYKICIALGQIVINTSAISLDPAQMNERERELQKKQTAEKATEAEPQSVKSDKKSAPAFENVQEGLTYDKLASFFAVAKDCERFAELKALWETSRLDKQKGMAEYTTDIMKKAETERMYGSTAEKYKNMFRGFLQRFSNKKGDRYDLSYLSPFNTPE